MKTERWTADKIRQSLKERKTNLVTFLDGQYRDMTLASAARLDGSYLVVPGPFETVIMLNSQKREKPEKRKDI